MKEKTIEIISTTLFFAGILIAAGTAGAHETGEIGLTSFLIQSVVAVVTMITGRFFLCLR